MDYSNSSLLCRRYTILEKRCLYDFKNILDGKCWITSCKFTVRWQAIDAHWENTREPLLSNVLSYLDCKHSISLEQFGWKGLYREHLSRSPFCFSHSVWLSVLHTPLSLTRVLFTRYNPWYLFSCSEWSCILWWIHMPLWWIHMPCVLGSASF